MGDQYPHWKQDKCPVFPLVLTLDEWLPSGQLLNQSLQEMVRARIGERGLATALVDRHPFSICSLSEFEALAKAIVEAGIGAVMSNKTKKETQNWAMLPFLNQEYKSQIATRPVLFEDGWKDLINSSSDKLT